MDENTTPANVALLQELVLRLTSYPGDLRTDNPQLLVEQLPPALPWDLATRQCRGCSYH